MASRIIFHIDMNSFYASVEQSHNPELKGKAIAIAGNPKERRGIIVTCSYEARAHGIYTTMQVHEAKRKYPDLLLLPPNFERYRAASKAIFEILRSYTEMVEPVSIDEGYVDVTELAEQRHALEIADEIQQRLLAELDLPCSIGIAPNKFLAKTASDMKKPLGITVLRKRDIKAMLWPKPVIEMHGIGESTAARLKSLKIETIGELAAANEGLVKEKMGKNGIRLQARANGVDDRPVDPDSIYDTKSVGTSTTLPVDETDEQNLKALFRQLSEKVANRLEAKELAGPTVSIQTRSSDWKNRTRSVTLNNTVWKADDIHRNAWQLFTKHWNGEPLRLIGVTVSNVADKGDMTEQLSIFNFQEHAREEPILDLMSQLESRFGKSVLTRGTKIKKANYDSKTSFSKDFLDDHERK
ncbi:DNA polymerase-4 [Planomicrobium stackebrandtii]|uniref:DNA polymerase IV n=1 Tax=Planomicrobium stackebrandtii TaxID=253160 RepID=A0ABU0GXL9_9BACL|nr:DNA polymerase IV [Planomicrobium stackebrandtii]MDQ0430106.1 DNA polymerase-4 [Planomicrobium stackebrandtii]